jgi:hypothetical protein
MMNVEIGEVSHGNEMKAVGGMRLEVERFALR